MADLKTLRLASIALTAGLLDQYVRYQRVVIAELARPAGGEWSGRFAFAHGRAVAECTFDALTLAKVKALVVEFCGKRSAVLTVRERVARAERALAEAQATGQPPPQKEQALVARARRELPPLEDLRDFEARYGAEARALLLAREAELVTLHRELARLEGGGHVHGGLG